MKTAILIPAHNAAETIVEVVKKVKDLGFSVIVVDDGSTDRTFEFAKEAGAVLLKNQKNMGKGAALRKGFEYILTSNFDAVITMDADGQHDPTSLYDFVKKAQETKADFILGNRMHNVKNMPWIRILTNRFMSRLLSKKIGQHIMDSQCGYRFIKKALLENLHLSTLRYEIESEMLVQAAELGAVIDSVPIPSIYDGHKSRINPVVDTWRFIRLMMTM